jgi:hypothetical protein
MRFLQLTAKLKQRPMKNKLIVATLQLAFAFTLCSCGTTYHAPDATKLKASAAKLQKAIVKSHDTAKKAKAKHAEVRAKHEESEQAANASLLNSFDIDEKLKHLAEQAPPELQPLVKAVQDVRTEQKDHESDLEKRLAEEKSLIEQEQTIHEQLTKDNTEVTSAENDVHRDGTQYLRDAEALAATATKENNDLRSQLWKQKLLKILGFGGIAIFVLIAVAVLIAWKTGKLYLKVKP